MSKDKKEKDTTPMNFPNKWWKIIQTLPEFKESADSSSEQDLKKVIVTCEGNLYTVNQEEAADSKLSGVKELIKEYSGPYKDAKKVQQAKIQYALFLLEGKGVDLNKSDES